MNQKSTTTSLVLSACLVFLPLGIAQADNTASTHLMEPSLSDSGDHASESAAQVTNQPADQLSSQSTSQSAAEPVTKPSTAEGTSATQTEGKGSGSEGPQGTPDVSAELTASQQAMEKAMQIEAQEKAAAAAAPAPAPAPADAKPAEPAAPPPPEPVTTQDLEVPADELKLLVKPFSQAELEVEAGGWFKVVQAKVAEVTEVELETSRLNKNQAMLTEQLEALKAADAPKDAAEKPKADEPAAPTKEELIATTKQLLTKLDPTLSSGDMGSADALGTAISRVYKTLDSKKEELTEKATGLRDERTALVDRFNAILDALNAKAGVKEDGTDNDLVVPFRRYITTVTGMNVDVTDTASTVKTLQKWAFSKEGGQRWVKNIALFLGILFGFWILSFILAAIAGKMLKVARNSSVLLHNFVVGLVKKVTMIIGVIMSLTALEVNTGPLLAALGAAGFILAFALQGTISNFASGLLMLLYRPFDVGDAIQAGGVSGSVESMSLVSTHVKTPDNQRIVVPNNAVWGGSITNASNSKRRRVDMTFTVSHKDNADTVRNLLEGIISKHPKVLADPAPLVRLDEIADGGMKFVVLPWSLTADAGDVKWDITREVKARFDNGELTMPAAA